eukprot:8687662-Pyramimonas_sp.AAC.1
MATPRLEFRGFPDPGFLIQRFLIQCLHRTACFCDQPGLGAHVAIGRHYSVTDSVMLRALLFCCIHVVWYVLLSTERRGAVAPVVFEMSYNRSLLRLFLPSGELCVGVAAALGRAP